MATFPIRWFALIYLSTATAAFRIASPESVLDSEELLQSTEEIVNRFSFRTPIIFFKDELRNFLWSNVLLERLRKPRLIVKKKNNNNLSIIRGFYVLFPAGQMNYEKLLNARNYDKSKFLIVWTRSNVTARDMQLLFEQFWAYQHINVVTLVNEKVYTYLPYTENNCGTVSEPVLLDTWDGRKRAFVRNADLFSLRTKVRDLRGCAVKTIGNHQPPDNIMRYDGHEWSASGVGGKMLEIVSAHLNFTPLVISTNITPEHTWYYFYEELKALSETLYRKEADLAFGWFSYSSIEIHNLELTVRLARVSSIDCFGWAVPYRAGRRPPNSAYYTYEFGTVTWCLVGATFLVTSVIMYCARKKSSSVWSAYRIVLEQPVLGCANNASFRLLFVSFAFYCLIVSGLYKASFGSFMTISLHGKDFSSVMDILNASSLQMCGSPEVFNLMNATAIEPWMLALIMKRLRVLKPARLDDIMSRLVRKRDIAVLGVKRSLYYHSIGEGKRIKVKIPFRFLPGCLLRAHTTHFMFRRGSHLIKPINNAVNRLFETGVIPYWIVHLGSNRVSPVERFRGRTIPLGFLKDAFMVLVTGYLASSVIFVVEILCYKYSGKRD